MMDLDRRRLRRRFDRDATIRSELARRVFTFLVDDWELDAENDELAVPLSVYADELATDATNVDRALGRLTDTGWVVEVRRDAVRGGTRPVVRPGPRWLGTAPSSRGREVSATPAAGAA